VSAQQGGTRTAGIQVIHRAASILRAIRDADDGLSLGQISQEVGLPRSTVQRIVASLQVEGWVAPTTPNALLRIGPALAEFAAVAGKADHVRAVHPSLVELSQRLQAAVELGVLDEDHVRFVDQVTAPELVDTVSMVGETLPLHCTATGKALLAALPLARAHELLPETLLRLTPRTVAGHDDLLDELEQVRMTGIGFDREEHTTGVCAVARTVTAPDGWTAAVTVPVPAERFYGYEHVLISVLDAACGDIQARLGE
jgi:DNA-binding IclR family transcriptional regulator